MPVVLASRQLAQSGGLEYDLDLAPQHTISTSDSSATSLSQYSYGLDGVNMVLDNQSSEALYIGIGIVVVVIIVLRVLQWSNAHLRQLTTYGSRGRQLYWTKDRSTIWAFAKRHLIYAPLRHIRHNKEIQLSNAVNVGTLPGRLHLFLLTLFLVAQIAFMSILNYSQVREATLAELRGRSGHLAVMNMIALFIFAGRNNPFIRVLRISFDTFNLFHRWIGRMIVIESVIHTLAWSIVKLNTSNWTALTGSLASPFLAWGLISVIGLVLIFFQSPSPIRHAAYETFLCLHQLFAFLTLLGVFYHAKLGKLPQYGFVVTIILIWTYDRLFRLGRLWYNNVSWKNGLTRVTVEALAGNACRVTFFTPRPFTPAAGSHVYVYLPRIAWWQSHPFSVAWTTSTDDIQMPETDLEKGAAMALQTQTSLSLIVQAKTGMTQKLYQLADKSRGKRLTLTGLVEGPYGSLESLHSYGTVVLFAGGVGITHHLSHVRDLVKGYTDGTISTQKITLVWIIRDEASLEWVRPWMDQILNLPGRRDIFTIKIFVTKSQKPEIWNASSRVQMSKGRPDINVIIQDEFKNRIGAMCVSVCGPGALADDVRCETRKVVDYGKVDFFEEAFTW